MLAARHHIDRDARDERDAKRPRLAAPSGGSSTAIVRHHLTDAPPPPPPPRAPPPPRERLHFCYLIANDLDKSLVKTHTYIGCSREPLRRVRTHNRELPGGPKNTKAAGELGAWRLRLVIGPIRANAKLFKKQWRMRSRGITSRARRGLTLAAEWGVPVYIDTGLFSDVRREDRTGRVQSEDRDEYVAHESDDGGE